MGGVKLSCPRLIHIFCLHKLLSSLSCTIIIFFFYFTTFATYLTTYTDCRFELVNCKFFCYLPRPLFETDSLSYSSPTCYGGELPLFLSPMALLTWLAFVQTFEFVSTEHEELSCSPSSSPPRGPTQTATTTTPSPPSTPSETSTTGRPQRYASHLIFFSRTRPFFQRCCLSHVSCVFLPSFSPFPLLHPTHISLFFQCYRRTAGMRRSALEMSTSSSPTSSSHQVMSVCVVTFFISSVCFEREKDVILEPIDIFDFFYSISSSKHVSSSLTRNRYFFLARIL